MSAAGVQFTDIRVAQEASTNPLFGGDSALSAALYAPPPKDLVTKTTFEGRMCRTLSQGLASYHAHQRITKIPRSKADRVKLIAVAIVKIVVVILALFAAIPIYPFAEIFWLIRYKRFLAAHVIENLLLPSNKKPRLALGLEALGDRVTSLDLKNEKGLSLRAYHVKLTQEPAQRLVIVFNPNGESCEGPWPRQAIADMGRFYPQESLEFLFFDYKGAGYSQGHTYHLDGVVDDSTIVMKWALGWLAQHQLDESALTLSGYSLGGGAAAMMAKKHPLAHLYLTHTFTNWAEAARGLANRFLPRLIGLVVRVFARVLGGHRFSPEQGLIEREAEAIRQNVVPGPVYVRSSSNDRMIAQTAALVIPQSCCDGPFYATYRIDLERAAHCDLGVLPREFFA